MRIESFRIRNCFGFRDSEEIDLGAEGNLVYFLGRNSSGKTSVLRAISYFEYGVVPQQQPNFENYERLVGTRSLQACFSIDSSKGYELSLGSFLGEAIQPFLDAGIQVQQTDDGFSHDPGVPGAKAAAALLDYVGETYGGLIEQFHKNGHVWVEKRGNGTYRFLTEEGEYESYEQRKESIDSQISSLNAFLGSHGRPQVPSDFDWIEGLHFKQFPEIFFFGDRFSLRDDLPQSITAEHLKGGHNALTDAFVSMLNVQVLRNMLYASGRNRLKLYTDKVQEQLDALSEKINKDAVRDFADADFIRFYTDRSRDVRIILEVDGGENHYEHLSDNTKFLIAYHILQEDRERKNSLPSILLFDEPSQGFHPTAEGKILRFLQSLADRGNQVLVSTHSQHLIDLDRLTAIRIMTRDEAGSLRVSNKLHGSSNASATTLAMQPVTDAIGLRYTDQLLTRDKVVIVEGYTELLYLRLFSRLLGYGEPNIAPVTGEGMTCSPKTAPATMRVRTSQMGRWRTRDEEEAHSGADRPQAAPGGRRTGCRGFGPRGRQETRHKRSDLPSLAQPLRRHEGRCYEAPQGAGGRERPPEEDRRRAGGGHRHPKGGEPKKNF